MTFEFEDDILEILPSKLRRIDRLGVVDGWLRRVLLGRVGLARHGFALPLLFLFQLLGQISLALRERIIGLGHLSSFSKG